ncbi:hypothetical protein HBI25_081650 [Parastagonospora nodorum]|nr:hypothetical protein HBI25_081650 [Parastagonospora nodorum]
MSREWQWIIERRDKLFLVTYEAYGYEPKGQGFLVRETAADFELERALRYGEGVQVDQVNGTEDENTVHRLKNGSVNGEKMVKFDTAKNCTINVSKLEEHLVSYLCDSD